MPLMADRVKETTTTTGTGTLTLGGAATGFQSFTAAFGNGASVYYVVAGGADWEVGIGTTGAGTLSRDVVLASSNANALVLLAAGTKDVFCAYVASRAVTTSDAATLTNKTIDDYSNNVGANSTHFRIKAGENLARGDVVKVSGFTPGEAAIQVVKTTAAADVALGIVEQTSLTTGQFGTAVVIGELFDVNTNGLTVGAALYSNGAGGYTTTKPSSGLFQSLGWVVRDNTNNGVIAVNVVNPQYVETAASTANTLALRDANGAAAFDAVRFDGSSSGTVTVQPAAAAGTWTLTLPTTDGDAGQFLTTDGSGVTSWSSPSGTFTDLTINPTVSTPYSVTSSDMNKRLVIGSSSFVPIINLLTANTSGIAVGSRFQVAAFGAPTGLNRTYAERVDTVFNPNPSTGNVPQAAVTQTDGKIIIAGSFTTVGGVTRNRIARFNVDGTLDTDYNPNINSTVYDLALLPDGKLIVAGQFTSVGGVARQYLARLNVNGTLDTAFTPATFNNYVNRCAVQPDGKIVVGGAWTAVNSIVQNQYMARVNADGSHDTTFTAYANGLVRGIIVDPDGKLVFVGDFTDINGQICNRFARLTSTGVIDTSAIPFNQSVLSITRQNDGKYVVCGAFSSPQARIARINTDGTRDTAFTTSIVGGDANSVAMQYDQKILVGGNFTTVNGTAFAYFARLNPDGTRENFNITFGQQIFRIVPQADGRALYFGNFTVINDGTGNVTRNLAARLGLVGNTASADTIVTPFPYTLSWPDLSQYTVVTVEKISATQWAITASNAS